MLIIERMLFMSVNTKIESKKEPAINVVLIQSFAPEGLVKQVKAFLECKIAKEVDGSIVCKVEIFEEIAEKNSDRHLVFVVCESREDLERWGAECPPECIIERRDLLPSIDSDGHVVRNAVEALHSRVTVMHQLYSGGLSEFELEDWFAGTFRRFMMLDETVHGTGNEIDLDNLKRDHNLEKIAKDPTSVEAKVFWGRFSCQPQPDDGMRGVCHLMRIVYKTQFDEVNGCREKEDRVSPLISIYTRCKGDYSGEKPFPRPLGFRVRYVTPTGKLNVLLVDDNPENAKHALTAADKSLDRFFSVTAIEADSLVTNQYGDVYQRTAIRLREFLEKKLSFDIALVDLCLNERSGEDLRGYRMILLVHSFFPATPVIVYSRFADREHILRAFQNGARWFLVKGEENKLPRYVLRLLRQAKWHREWDAVMGGAERPHFIHVDDPYSAFARRFDGTEEWQYLTYASLRFLPGEAIWLKPLNEGASSAVTFKAVKGVKLDGAYLQSPRIVKIDHDSHTRMEKERYSRMIRPYLDNEVGRIEQDECTLSREFSAIVYTYAGKHDQSHVIDTMGAFLKADIRSRATCDYERYRSALDELFEEILPKIHRVTPQRELGRDCYDLHTGVVDSPASKFSSFPNPYFDEFLPKSFWYSYVRRLPPQIRELKFKFEEQATYTVEEHHEGGSTRNEATNAEERPCYIFHAARCQRGRWVIEVFDKEQNPVWLTGAYAEHIARFRKQVYPGMSLWLPSDGVSNEAAPAENSWLKDALEGDGEVMDGEVADMLSKCGLPNCGLVKSDALMNQLVVNLVKIAKCAKTDLENIYNGGADKRAACDGWLFASPVAIVHGDLNYWNIMLEKRRGERSPACGQNGNQGDLWLIDFARTRRDIIAHDFNVLFTSTLALLFERDLAEEPGCLDDLSARFYSFVHMAVCDDAEDLDMLPDAFADDRRLSMIYKMLRRIRAAALKAGVSQDMFELTTAFASLNTLKVYLGRSDRQDKRARVKLAAAMLVVALVCYRSLWSKHRNAAGTSDISEL